MSLVVLLAAVALSLYGLGVVLVAVAAIRRRLRIRSTRLPPLRADRKSINKPNVENARTKLARLLEAEPAATGRPASQADGEVVQWPRSRTRR